MKIIAIFTFISLLISSNIIAQDEILLTNGKTKYGEVLEIGEEYIFYQKLNKYKIKNVLTKDVYLVDFEDSARTVIYKQDESDGFNLTTEQMDLYILGEQDCRNNYKAPWVTVGGLFSGAVGGVGIVPPAYGLLVPTAYAGISGLGIPNVKERMVENTDLLNNDYFMSGYQYTASKKRVRNALIGGTIGFSLAVGIIMIVAE